MSVGRSEETIFSVGADKAGGPVVMSRLHINNYEDGKQSGRFETVAARVAQGGADLTYTTYEGGYAYHNSTDETFERQHAVELGYFEDELNDGRALPIELPHFVLGDRNPQWLVQKTIRMNDGDNSYKFNWSVGRKESLQAMRAFLGQTGLAADALFSSTYYGLSYVSNNEPLLYTADMQERTKAELRLLDEIDGLLMEQHMSTKDMRDLLGEAPALKRPQSAVAEFVQSRRKAHEIEAKLSERIARAAVSPLRLLPPTGHGRNGRTWPYMDATVSDEGVAFGAELNALQEGDLGRASYELMHEEAEIRGRRDAAQEVIRSLLVLDDYEKRDSE